MTHRHPADRLEEIHARLSSIPRDVHHAEVEVSADTGAAEAAFTNLYEHAYIDMNWMMAEIFRLRTDKVRALTLARTGTSIEVNPNLVEEPDVMFWYDHLRKLDGAWREAIRDIHSEDR